MQGLELILRHFWAWLCLTNTAMLSESKDSVDLLGGFFWQETPSLNDPYI